MMMIYHTVNVGLFTNDIADHIPVFITHSSYFQTYGFWELINVKDNSKESLVMIRNKLRLKKLTTVLYTGNVNAAFDNLTCNYQE